MGQYYGVVRSYTEWVGDSLAHHGIKGQKWGVRRYQNEDGSYTPEGKERYYDSKFDKGVKEGKYDDDPEIREIYVMEQIDLDNRDRKAQEGYRNQVTANSTALTKKDKALIGKVKNSQELSSRDNEALRSASSDYQEKNHELEQKYFAILEKNRGFNFTEDDKKYVDSIADQMTENRKAMNELEYAKFLNSEHEYSKSIRGETNTNLVDPSYRSFNSKEEKAKAEHEYLMETWYKDPDDLNDASAKKEYKKYEREWQHITNKVNGLSMDGYEGIPKSERNKALFDYDDDLGARHNTFDTYENWTPKYEKSKEWISLQTERKKIRDELGVDKAYDAFAKQPVKTFWEKDKSDKLWKAYIKARKQYEARCSDIESSENAIKKNFEQQICKNTLLDMGFEVTPENISAIKGIIWYD